MSKITTFTAVNKFTNVMWIFNSEVKELIKETKTFKRINDFSAMLGKDIISFNETSTKLTNNPKDRKILRERNKMMVKYS